MKKLFVLPAFLFLSATGAQAQQHSCCAPAGVSFAQLSADPVFAMAHAAPLPYHYEGEAGSMITFNTLDATPGKAFYLPSPQATGKTLIIFHEWWGLNDYIKKEAVQWQTALGNVDVYAIDLYDGKVAETGADASMLMGGLSTVRGQNIIKGLLSKIGNTQQVATLGWCMGGTWAFNAAVLAGQQAAGCVMYYGFPETEAKNIRPIKTDVLYIRATKDKFVAESAVDFLEKEVKNTGHKFKRGDFDAVHAFANPSNPDFDAASAAAAKSYSLAFLKKMLVIE